MAFTRFELYSTTYTVRHSMTKLTSTCQINCVASRFNSAVFEVSSTNDYSVAVVSEAFTQGAEFDERLRPLDFARSGSRTAWVDATASTPTRWPFTTLQQRIAQLERLTIEECVDAYQNPIISDRRNLLAVASDIWLTKEGLTNESSLLDFTFSTIDGSWDTAGGSTAWICAYLPKYWNSASPPSCLASDVIANITNITSVQTLYEKPIWVIMGFPIQYCLSEVVDDQHCQLQMSTLIMVVVLVCNLIKTIVMTLSLRHMGGEMLVTIGDAAVSFLKDEDMNTLSDRLVSKDYLPDPCWSGDSLKVRTWRDNTKRWWQAPSLLLWCWCVLLWTCAFIIACVLLPRSLNQLTINGVPTNLRSLWNQGFGTVHNNNLVKLGKAQSYQNGVIGMVLLSNLPQILITGMYLAYNSIFTCMISNDEWVRFGSKRKPLRVSAPRGDQRSTYFLQLPYALSIPLLCSSALLHWLVSQSVFLARIRIFDMFGQENQDANITTVGYSCIALILATTVGGGMIICCIALGFRHYPVGAPAISNSSRRISAACHPPKDELCIAYKAVQWGVITKNTLIRHCTLSTRTVQGGSCSKVYALHSNVDASIAGLGKMTGIGQESTVPSSRPPDISEDPTLITRSNAFLIENYGSRDYRPRRCVPSQLPTRSQPLHEEFSSLLCTDESSSQRQPSILQDEPQ